MFTAGKKTRRSVHVLAAVDGNIGAGDEGRRVIGLAESALLAVDRGDVDDPSPLRPLMPSRTCLDMLKAELSPVQLDIVSPSCEMCFHTAR